jgi:hypothetical protein
MSNKSRTEVIAERKAEQAQQEAERKSKGKRREREKPLTDALERVWQILNEISARASEDIVVREVEGPNAEGAVPAPDDLTGKLPSGPHLNRQIHRPNIFLFNASRRLARALAALANVLRLRQRLLGVVVLWQPDDDVGAVLKESLVEGSTPAEWRENLQLLWMSRLQDALRKLSARVTNPELLHAPPANSQSQAEPEQLAATQETREAERTAIVREEIPYTSPMSSSDMARRLRDMGCSRATDDAVDAFLRRHRNTCPDCLTVQDAEDRRRNDPKYLYRAEVWPALVQHFERG